MRDIEVNRPNFGRGGRFGDKIEREGKPVVCVLYHTTDVIIEKRRVLSSQ